MIEGLVKILIFDKIVALEIIYILKRLTIEIFNENLIRSIIIGQIYVRRRVKISYDRNSSFQEFVPTGSENSVLRKRRLNFGSRLYQPKKILKIHAYYRSYFPGQL